MDWLKNHGDTIIILGTFAACFWTINEKFTEKLNNIEREIAVIKAVLVMKNIMPDQLCQVEHPK